MIRARDSRPTDYFETLYASNPDPWQFNSSGYERKKYAATLAALPRPRYRCGFEVGCSIGMLTRLLAARCDRLLAIDAAAAPLPQARAATADLAHVRIAQMRIPAEWPDQHFDVILLSEVLYFLSAADVAGAAAAVARTVSPGGTVVLVNWTGRSDDPCSGNQAATIFIDAAASVLRPLTQSRTPGYRLDVLAAAPAATHRE
jgi:2-polyprenyl-3-methyl-5-hydroxy-6-metoxy-1,4-benzoquinol methylase